MYRVWTKNFDGGVSCMTDWRTYGQCMAYIIARWVHWPPFAYISKAQTADLFRRYNGK